MSPYVWVHDPLNRRGQAQLWRLESYLLDWARHVYDPANSFLRGVADRQPVNISCKGWKLHVCSDEQTAVMDMWIAHRLLDKLDTMALEVMELLK